MWLVATDGGKTASSRRKLDQSESVRCSAEVGTNHRSAEASNVLGLPR